MCVSNPHPPGGGIDSIRQPEAICQGRGLTIRRGTCSPPVDDANAYPQCDDFHFYKQVLFPPALLSVGRGVSVEWTGSARNDFHTGQTPFMSRQVVRVLDYLYWHRKVAYGTKLKPKAHLLTQCIEKAKRRLKTPSQFRQRIFDFWRHLCIRLAVKYPHLF